MADIDIQKKKKSSPLLWILGILSLLALIFLIWWLMNISDGEATGIYDDKDTTEQDYVEPTDASAIEAAGPIAAYISWTDSMGNADSAQMGIHHEFTKNGLQKMAAALAAISERAENVNKDEFDKKLTKMRNMADSITNNWESTQHANKIKRAFEASTDVMKELQSTSFNNLQQDVSKVQNEVKKLDAKQLTLEQKNRVKTVFRKSADVIKKMENNLAEKR